MAEDPKLRCWGMIEHWLLRATHPSLPNDPVRTVSPPEGYKVLLTWHANLERLGVRSGQGAK